MAVSYGNYKSSQGRKTIIFYVIAAVVIAAGAGVSIPSGTKRKPRTPTPSRFSRQLPPSRHRSKKSKFSSRFSRRADLVR